MNRCFALALCLFVAVAVQAADRQIISRGSYPGDRRGDDPWTMIGKLNANFLELFNRASALGTNGLPPTNSLASWRSQLALDAPLNAKWLGVKGDGETDDTDTLQAAIATARTANRALFLPAGTYLISDTIDLSGGQANEGWISIYGEPVDAGYKGATPRRTVIQTAGNITAVKVPDCSACAYQSGWARFINLRDLYIVGTRTQVDSYSDSIGLDLRGIMQSQLRDIHVEGFGTGFRLENFDTVQMVNLEAQNCYFGMWTGRGASGTDGVGQIDQLNLINNQISLWIDNARGLWVRGGIFGNNITNEPSPSRLVVITNMHDTGEIHFKDLIIENQNTNSTFLVTSNGFGQLTLENCNLEANNHMATNAMFDIQGTFDLLALEGNNFDRFFTYTNKAPLVHMHGDPPTYYYRQNRVVLENNSPAWFEFVRNDFTGARMEQDYVPSGYVQLVPEPDLRHLNDGCIAFDGTYDYNTNALNGVARLYWTTTDASANYLAFTPRKPVRGIQNFTAFVTANDEDGDTIPQLGLLGWGTYGVDWEQIARAKIGSYTIDGTTFSKYAISCVLKTLTYADTGIETFQFNNFYGGPDTSGIERLTIWVPQQHSGARVSEDSSRIPVHPNAWSGGYGRQGDVIWNSFATNSVYGAWICTESGVPGTWRPFMLEPGLKVVPHAGGAVELDLNDERNVRLLVNGDVNPLTVTNHWPGRTMTIFAEIVVTNAAWQFSTNWHWLTGVPVNTEAGNAIIQLYSSTTSDTGVYAWWKTVRSGALEEFPNGIKLGAQLEVPNNTALYGTSTNGSGTIAIAMVDAANRIFVAPGGDTVVLGGTTTINSSLRIGGATGPQFLYGTGSPEGVATADPGSWYSDRAGLTNSVPWFKQTGAGNTGWKAITLTP